MIDKDILKQDLIENPNKTIKILNYLQFHSFNVRGDKLRCALPDRNGPTSVAVDLNTLYCNIFVSPTFQGDLYGMLLHYNEHFGRNYKWDFSRVLEVIHNILIRDTDIKDNGDFINIKRALKSSNDDKHKKNIEYDLSYLNSYSQGYYQGFTKEGISYDVQDKYHICIDEHDSRALIPHFRYNDKNVLVGLQGRTIYSNYEMLDIPKYINYITGFEKSKNLFALSHNIDEIKMNKKMVIFEAEKSVMKLESIIGMPCIAVALGGSSLSDWQANYIGKLSLEIEDFEVIIALDKDVAARELIAMCDKLKSSGCSKVSYILDNSNLLEDKDSPIDKGYSIWLKLFEQRCIRS